MEENIEEIEIMEKAGHALLNNDDDLVEDKTTKTVSAVSGSGTDHKSVQGKHRFDMLKRKLFGPELEQIQARFNNKLAQSMKAIKEEILKQLETAEYRLTHKVAIVEEYMLTIDTIQSRHKEFVQHLGKIHDQFNEKFTELDQKVIFC